MHESNVFLVAWQQKKVDNNLCHMLVTFVMRKRTNSYIIKKIPLHLYLLDDPRNYKHVVANYHVL